MSLAPSPTVLDLITATRRRLGEGGVATEIWTVDELLGYFRDGLLEWSRITRALWDLDGLDDIAVSANHSYHFEPSFIRSRSPKQYTGITNLDREIHTIGSRTEYDFPWERDYADSSAGPGEMDFTWERLYAPTSSQHCAAVVALPDGLLDIERVAWDDRRLDALRSSELERKDRQYEASTGDVLAYTNDKDGLDNLRKYHIPVPASIPHVLGIRGIPRGTVDPTTAGLFYMHLDEWAVVLDGELDTVPSLFDDFNPGIEVAVGTSWDDIPSLGFGSYAVEGSGSLRLVPGYHPSRSVYGIARRFSPSTRNTMVEFRRQAITALDLTDRPELAPHVLTYIRHYVCWRALKRRSRGQNLRLAEHYKQRWEVCVARTTRRLQLVHSQREIVLGGSGEAPTQPPLARPPWELDYGQMDRY